MTIAVKNSFSIEFSNWAELTINFVFTGKTFVVLKLKQTSAKAVTNYYVRNGRMQNSLLFSLLCSVIDGFIV